MPLTRHTTWTTAALTGAAVVVVGGCAREAAEPPDAVGPASAYVDLVLGTTQESAEARAVRYEEVVAACMAEAGFEYLPNLAGYFFYDESAVDPPRDSREFAERYGYGYASAPEEMRRSGGAGDDPNSALIAEMSESEAGEYHLALYGTVEEDFVAAGSPEDFVPDLTHYGCTGRAMLEVSPEADPTYLALQDEIDRIEAEVVPADPDVVAADAEWAECMADAGFPGYARQPEAAEQERERFMASGGGAGVVGSDGLTDREREEIAQEVLLATADWDCADQTGYHDVVARVRNKAQQEYVDAHRDELDAWVAEWAEDAA